MPEDRSHTSIASADLSAEINPMGAELFALRDGEGPRPSLGGAIRKSGPAGLRSSFPSSAQWATVATFLDGQTYHLGKHGFARHKLFHLVSVSAAEAVFRLTADPETLESYPFEFELDIGFALSGKTPGDDRQGEKPRSPAHAGQFWVSSGAAVGPCPTESRERGSPAGV